MQMSEKLDKLMPALFKVKQELGPVKKGAFNPHFKSSFADLNTHIETLEPVLEKHGLMVLQPPVGNSDGSNRLTTILIHVESGQYIESSLNLTNVPDMQKTLAGITYARRGTLNALFGLASVDDDGETAVGRGKSLTKPTYTQLARSVAAPAPTVKAEAAEEALSTSSFRKKVVRKSIPEPEVSEESDTGGWE